MFNILKLYGSKLAYIKLHANVVERKARPEYGGFKIARVPPGGFLFGKLSDPTLFRFFNVCFLCVDLSNHLNVIFRLTKASQILQELTTQIKQ